MLGQMLEGGIRIEALIGEGSAARVYRGSTAGRDVAVKVFSTPPSPHLVGLVEGAEAPSHPNLVELLGHGVCDGTHYLIMELGEGALLEDLLSAGKLPLGQALDIAIGIADGLAALHAEGWVHRDIKPHNVIVSEDGAPKVLDFGLAAREGSLGDPERFQGSWDYVAPEQAVGGPICPKGDIYSLGVVLYEMVLGRVPFGDSPITAVLGHLHERPRLPRLLDPSIPGDVETAVMRALEKDPADRFPSMEAFGAALRGCKDRLLQQAPPPRANHWPALGLLAAIIFAALVLLCSGG